MKPIKNIKLNRRNILLNALAYLIAFALYFLLIVFISKLGTITWWHLPIIFIPWIAWLYYVFKHKMISMVIGDKVLELP